MKLSHRSCILFLFALSACCLHDGAAAEAFSAAQPKASRTRVSAAQTRDLHRLASATELTALPNDGDFPSSNRGSRRRRSFFSKILPLRAGGEGESSPSSSLSREMLAELLGTFLIVQIGTGSVMAAVFDNALVGLFQIAAVWSIAVTLAISATASVSGAHLNPAITIALAMLRPGGWAKVIPYCLSQLVGAILGSWVNLILYASKIREFEATNAIVRGTAGSVASAKAFGEYFVGSVTWKTALFAEAFGTAILSFVIFSLTNPKNDSEKTSILIPPLIGATVGALICVLAPLTQAGFNPARDFGPRIVAAMAGWGKIAYQGWWVYVVGPIIGAPVGAYLAEKVLFAEGA